MNPMNTSLPEGIKCCFVYNRTLDVSDEQANDEDHCEKILYYIPQNASISEKARDISIADALIEFSGSFDSESSIQVVRSDKYSYHFCRWEKDTWFVIAMRIYEYRDNKSEVSTSFYSPSIVSDVMKGLYDMYRLVYDPMEPSLYKTDASGAVIVQELLKKRVALRKAKFLEECLRSGEVQSNESNSEEIASIPSLTSAIESLQSQSSLPSLRANLSQLLQQHLLCFHWNQLHFLYSMDGFLQLPVDPQPALAIHTLMTQLRVQVPALRSTSFLFNDYFLWSDLSLPAQRLLYRFLLAQRLFPAKDEDKMILHLPGETALRLLRVRAGRCELALLVEPEQEVESVRASVLQAVGETGQTIETELMNTRNRLGKTDNSLVYFFHDGMTNLMESNVREPSFAVAAITPREMMAAVPDFMGFPMDCLFGKLRAAEGFVEAIERVRDNYWVYGCKQEERMVLIMVKTPFVMKIDNVMSSVHHFVEDVFKEMFTLL
ncbi:hypothetical protein WA588_005537 [Blastocystis sp. NMH]